MGQFVFLFAMMITDLMSFEALVSFLLQFSAVDDGILSHTGVSYNCCSHGVNSNPVGGKGKGRCTGETSCDEAA